MLNFKCMGIEEYLVFIFVTFLLLAFDAIITNIVARAVGKEYYKVEPLPWIKWLYKRIKFGFALFLHFVTNIFILAVIFLLPMKASYLLLFTGMFILRVWSVAYKAYIYSRGGI